MSYLIVTLRDAVRALRASALPSTLTIVSLALGIGANAALFSLLNGLLLKPLPVRAPHQLVLLAGDSWTNPIWEQIRDHQHTITAGAFAWGTERFDLSDGGQTELVDGLYASGNMFEVLGVQALRGRVLTQADDVRGGGADGAVVVISYAFWQRRFGGDPDVVGQTLRLERVPFRIVGVTPRGFFGPDVGRAADVMVPLASERLIRGAESFLDGRSTWWLEVMARLGPQQTADQATDALRALQPAIRLATMPTQYPAQARDRYLSTPLTLVPAATGRSDLRARYGQPLLILLGVSALVLVIACANVANLMLARATARRQELSIRLALGATRARLIGQVLAESLMLAMGGAAAGVALAMGASAALARQLTTWRGTVSLDLSQDWRLLLFAVAVASVTTVIVGLAPAMTIRSIAPHDALKDAGRGVSGDRRFRTRSALVIMQLAMSLVLLVAAGLFLRTFVSLTRVPLGLAPAGLAIVDVNLQRAGDPAMRASIITRLTEAAVAVPGVSRAAAAMITPLSGRGWNGGVGPGVADSRGRMTWKNAVSPGWFDTIGARLLAGRDFTSEDTPGSPAVTIVNETFAHRFLQPGSAVGQVIESGGMENATRYLVVGLVADTAYRSPREGMVPTMFLPMQQADRLPEALALVVRTPSSLSTAGTRALSDALTSAEPRIALTFRSFDELLAATVTQERLVAMLSVGFGVLAVVLAAVGLYGVMSYSVHQQRSEYGVRMALGASPARVLRLVLRRASLITVVGLTAGAGAAWWALTAVRTLLFQLDPRDGWTFAGAALILLLVASAAATAPAWRASRIDPARVLRNS